MPADLSAYTIRLASPAQAEEHWRASFVPWNRGKDWEAFKADQIRTADGEWAQDGGFRCWVLVKRDNFDGPIYSGCETYRRKTFMKDPNSDEFKDVYSYAIASVVTPVPHLRKGLATHFLRLLHYQLADPTDLPPFPSSAWGAAPPALSASDRSQVPFGIASILYSDVGSTFYERATIGTDISGWVVNDANCQQLTWALKQPQPRTANQDKSHWDWVYARDLPAIGKQLSSTARDRLLTQHQSATDTVWAFDPANPGTLSFVPTTAMWYRAADTQFTLDTEPCGLRLPSIRPDQDEAIVLFVGSQAVIGNALLVTYIHNVDAERLTLLLEALDEAGTQMEMKEGWVWGLDAESGLRKSWLDQPGRVAKYGRRDESMGHLLGVAWYGSTERRGTLVDTQMWAWC